MATIKPEGSMLFTREVSARDRMSWLARVTRAMSLKALAFPRRLLGSRWITRVFYALDRLPKTLRLLEVRYWRRWTVSVYYRRQDHAPPPSKITLRITNACNLRCVQCAQWGEAGVFRQMRPPTASPQLTTADWKRFIARLAPVCPHIY